MASARLAKSERAALCDLLEEVGPDAPTLCEGWTTLDLAAHLVVRERRIDAGPGLLVPALAGWTDTVRTRAKAHGLQRLVAQIRTGPPVYSPMRLLDESVNGLEYFIHHEDVRRCQPDWTAPVLPADLSEQLWKRVSSGARLATRRAPVGVVLQCPDGASVVARSGMPSVTVIGTPCELALFTSGRRSAAQVELQGDPAAIARLGSVKLGF